MTAPGRVLVIALQEATLDLIRPWAEDGALPVLKAMMDSGICGDIAGVEPLSTPHSWGNILTGKGAGYHGVFDFWQRDNSGRFNPTSRTSLREKPVWTLLDEGGLKSAILNLPLSYPPEAAGGFMVSGLEAPGITRSIAAPPEIYDQIIRRFGKYRPAAVFPGGRQKADYLGLFERETSRQAEVYAYLLSRNEWDFAMVYFVDAAMAQHYFWADMASGDASNPYRDILKTAYRCLDDAIGRLMAAAGPQATVFVVSECGAGPIRYGVQINSWLHREGFLGWKRSAPAGPISSQARLAFSQWSDMGKAFAKRHAPESIRSWLKQYVPALKGSQADNSSKAIDWSRTRAFAQGKEGSLFINLKGRDPHGIVAPGAEYDAVRQEIVDRLGELRDPDTGGRAVTRVSRREDLFRGPMIEMAPDLFIEWRDDMYMPAEQTGERDKVFVTRYRDGMSWPTSGSHRLEGVIIASGPGIRPGTRLSGATTFDLLPTWLQLLGQPLPEGLQGRPLDGVVGTPSTEKIR